MGIPNQGNFLLFDDDCGICTIFSKFLGRLLGDTVIIVPMHIPEVEKQGLHQIGDDYWQSFHIVKDGHWTTEGEAILELCKLFPLGELLSRVASFPLIYWFLIFLLHQFQQIRKVDCEVDFS